MRPAKHLPLQKFQAIDMLLYDAIAPRKLESGPVVRAGESEPLAIVATSYDETLQRYTRHNIPRLNRLNGDTLGLLQQIGAVPGPG